MVQDPEAMVIDHIKYAVTEVEGDHTLIAGDDLIQSDVILGPKKIVSTNTRNLPDSFKHLAPFRFLHVHWNNP